MKERHVESRYGQQGDLDPKSGARVGLYGLDGQQKNPAGRDDRETSPSPRQQLFGYVGDVQSAVMTESGCKQPIGILSLCAPRTYSVSAGTRSVGLSSVRTQARPLFVVNRLQVAFPA